MAFKLCSELALIQDERACMTQLTVDRMLGGLVVTQWIVHVRELRR